MKNLLLITALALTALVEWRRINALQQREDELEHRETRLEEEMRRLESAWHDAEERAERMSAKVEEVQQQIDAERDRAKDAEARLLIAEQNAEAELANMRLKLRSIGKPSAPDADDEDDAGPAVESFRELVSAAREHLSGVVIPESAERDLHVLDASRGVKVWAASAWRGLRALDEYARSAEEFSGGFWEWCEHSSAAHRWPATEKKLAMRESRTVSESPDLRRLRLFEISTDVKDSGETLMEAHLKISEGGGENIPRIYFYDDSKGGTKSVHIGFIGPHRLVPNTQTS